MNQTVKSAKIGFIALGLYAILATLVIYLVILPFDNNIPAGTGIRWLGLPIMLFLILFIAPLGLAASIFLHPIGIDFLSYEFDLINSIVGIIFFALLGAIIGAAPRLLILISKIVNV